MARISNTSCRHAFIAAETARWSLMTLHGHWHSLLLNFRRSAASARSVKFIPLLARSWLAQRQIPRHYHILEATINLCRPSVTPLWHFTMWVDLFQEICILALSSAKMPDYHSTILLEFECLWDDRSAWQILASIAINFGSAANKAYDVPRAMPCHDCVSPLVLSYDSLPLSLARRQ